jgi:capsular polysaccharide biosynthesis protein
MRPETQVRPRERERPWPDIDAEEELELGRYWNALLARWWLPLAGLIAGIVLGYLLSLGGKQVYKANATIYLGQPLSASGTQIQGPSTNPSAVRQVVFSRWAQERAERAAGLRTGSLNGHVSTQTIQGQQTLTRTGQNPLVSIVATGSKRARLAAATNELATIATQQVSGGYVATKIAYLKRQVAAQNDALKSIDHTIAILREGASGRNLSTTERLIIASQLNGQALQRSQVVDQLATYQNQLTLAQTVEQSKILTPARSEKTTARSRRNSVLVGAVIGLLLGILAALLWEPAARLARRTRI